MSDSFRDPWAVSGSASLVLRGYDIGRPVNDVDLFLTTSQWLIISRWGIWEVVVPPGDDVARCCDPPHLRATPYEMPFEAYFAYRQTGMSPIDVALWIHNREMVNGVPCVPLNLLLDWKSRSGRAKDALDVARVAEQLTDV